MRAFENPLPVFNGHALGLHYVDPVPPNGFTAGFVVRPGDGQLLGFDLHGLDVGAGYVESCWGTGWLGRNLGNGVV